MNHFPQHLGTRQLRLGRKDRSDENGVHESSTQVVSDDWRTSLINVIGTDRSPLLGAYRLINCIGSGAMGHVYRAKHVLLGRMVAIKVLRPELASDEACANRFLAEARAVSSIDHEHVIDVIDFAREANGAPWFVMELLDGVDLRAAQINGPIALRRSLEVVRQLCDALHAVHAAGFVHCDVKPSNTFISQRDGKDVVKLIDFGIARSIAAASDTASADEELAKTGVVGTPPYMAPEQLAVGSIDHRVDLYAVGAVLFQLVTGSAPFHRDDVRVLVSDMILAAPPVPSSLIDIPEVIRNDLDALILRCLAKDPDARPQSARELAASVAELATRLSSSKQAPRAAHATRFGWAFGARAA